MAIDYDYYALANSQYKDVHDRGTITGDVQKAMDEDLKNNLITEFDVKIGMDFYRETVLVNFERELDCIIKFKRMKEAVYNSSARELLCEAGGVKTGDYVQHTNKQAPYDVRNYLVRNNIDPKKGYESSFILICQHSLKWIDDNDKTVIHDYPVSFIDNKTMLGEAESSLATLPSDIQQCFIQENEFTSKIANGKRFISNRKAFEVIGVDEQTINGLISLRLRKVLPTSNDNIELGIADYYKVFEGDEDNPTNPDIPTDGFTLTLSGKNDITCGFTSVYNVNIVVDGEVVDDQDLKWELLNMDGTTNLYASIENISGYTCKVRAGNSKTIGKTVILTVSLESDSAIFDKKNIQITGY